MGVIMPAVRVAPTSYEAYLPHSSISVRQARARLAQDLSERDVLGTVVDDAILILSEFVTNALKHSKKGGRPVIEVRLTEEEGGELQVAVSDAGPGLPADFDLANARGLGMRIVRALCEELGGRLSFERLGEGSRFAAAIPLQKL